MLIVKILKKVVKKTLLSQKIQRKRNILIKLVPCAINVLDKFHRNILNTLTFDFCDTEHTSIITINNNTCTQTTIIPIWTAKMNQKRTKKSKNGKRKRENEKKN